MENTYSAYAMLRDGRLLSFTVAGWMRTNRPTRYSSLTSLREARGKHGIEHGMPYGTVDAYIWSHNSECSFQLSLSRLEIVKEALAKVDSGEMCYENAEILHRLPHAEWQLQFIGEACMMQPAEFADIVSHVLRRKVNTSAG